MARNYGNSSREKLHASLALLPVDDSQVPFLEGRLAAAGPPYARLLVSALYGHRATLTPRLWAGLKAAKPGDAGILPIAAPSPSLTRTAPTGGTSATTWPRPWSPPTLSSSAIGSRRCDPCGSRSPPTLSRSAATGPAPRPSACSPPTSSRTTRATIPNCWPSCCWTPIRKRIAIFFPVAEQHPEEALPVFLAELKKNVPPSWNDPALDPSWTKADPAIAASIESARGLLGDRFAFCQTMPLAEFPTVAEGLRKAGYRPVRFRPYADGPVVKVAAVWARDGKRFLIEPDASEATFQQASERNHKEGFIPVDVAGYTASDAHGKPVERYAALWVLRAAGDERRPNVRRQDRGRGRRDRN